MLTAGNALGNSPFVGIASIGGLTALTLFSATVNFLVAMTILKINNGDRRKTMLFGAAAILLVLSGYLFSNIELKNNSLYYSQLSGRLNIAAISIDPSFDMEFEVFKNDELSAEEKITAKNLIQRTIEPLKLDLKNKDLDLVILPEDMIDITVTNDTDKEAYQKYRITNAGLLINAYRELAKDLDSNVLAIMTTVKDDYRRISSVLFDKNGEISGVYDKSTMTIGSEYWPFKKWRPFYYNWLGKIMPDIKDDSPIFDQKYTYQKGTMKVLENGSIPAVGSPICIEIFYPYQIKQFKNMGAKFIVHSSSNVWTVDYGLKSYLEVSDKIRIIESVWLKMPIIFNGRSEAAGLTTPDGKIKTTPYVTDGKNYGIGFETINF
jgi:apolipoprotein N-acyltransferase